MTTDQSLVCVYRASDLIEANLLRGMLEHEGIRVTLTGENLIGAYSGVPKLCEVRIMVPTGFRRAAEAVLSEYQDRQSASEPEDDWRCRTCGEINEQQFAACWQCERPRGEV